LIAFIWCDTEETVAVTAAFAQLAAELDVCADAAELMPRAKAK